MKHFLIRSIFYLGCLLGIVMVPVTILFDISIANWAFTESLAGLISNHPISSENAYLFQDILQLLKISFFYFLAVAATIIMLVISTIGLNIIPLIVYSFFKFFAVEFNTVFDRKVLSVDDWLVVKNSKEVQELLFSKGYIWNDYYSEEMKAVINNLYCDYLIVHFPSKTLVPSKRLSDMQQSWIVSQKELERHL